MVLKRKRSSATFSSPTSVCSSDSYPQISSPLSYFYTQSKPVEPLYQKPSWPLARHDAETTSRDLNSRTRKRHKDDRPDEQTVYGVSAWIGAVIEMSTLADVCRCAATTISRLFEAQREQPHATPITSQSPQSLQSSAQPQRNTLHSFWQIRQPPASSSMAIDFPAALENHNKIACEDCDQALQDDDAMQLDEGSLEQEAACELCRRLVCDKCAILGDRRVCLSCATSAA